MTSFTPRHLLRGTVAAALLCLALPVAASPAFSTAKIRIATSDIDLASPADMEKLVRRVDYAVRSACGPSEFGGGTPYGSRDKALAEAECLANARAATAPLLKKLGAGERLASN